MIGFFEKNQLNKILKYFPGFIIFLGIVKLIFFYKSFNIQIVDYLNLSEVLISFIDKAILYIIIAFVPILLVLTFWGEVIAKSNTITFEEKLSKNFSQRVFSDIKENIFPFILTLIGIIFFIVKGKWSIEIGAIYFSYFGCYIVIFITREIRIAYKKQYNYSIPPTYLNFFFLIYLFTILLLQNTIQEIKEIKEKHKYLGTMIFLEKETITCDSNNTYVGQTNDYLFLYSISEKRSTVIPKKGIQKIIFNSY
jgi:hypothetical protein